MEKTCGKSGFNFCFWAKLLVAIPALPLLGVNAASFFDNPDFQAVAAVVAIGLAVTAAVWLDRLPVLQKKFRKCSRCDN